jgi:hypothetical protein
MRERQSIREPEVCNDTTINISRHSNSHTIRNNTGEEYTLTGVRHTTREAKGG